MQDGFPHYRSEHKQRFHTPNNEFCSCRQRRNARVSSLSFGDHTRRVLSSNGFLSVIGGEPVPTPTCSAKAARVPSLSRSWHTQRVLLTQERVHSPRVLPSLMKRLRRSPHVIPPTAPSFYCRINVHRPASADFPNPQP